MLDPEAAGWDPKRKLLWTARAPAGHQPGGDSEPETVTRALGRAHATGVQCSGCRLWPRAGPAPGGSGPFSGGDYPGPGTGGQAGQWVARKLRVRLPVCRGQLLSVHASELRFYS